MGVLRRFCGAGGIIYRPHFFMLLKRKKISMIKNARASQRRTISLNLKPNTMKKNTVQRYDYFLILANFTRVFFAYSVFLSYLCTENFKALWNKSNYNFAKS